MPKRISAVMTERPLIPASAAITTVSTDALRQRNLRRIQRAEEAKAYGLTIPLMLLDATQVTSSHLLATLAPSMAGLILAVCGLVLTRHRRET